MITVVDNSTVVNVGVPFRFLTYRMISLPERIHVSQIRRSGPKAGIQLDTSL